MLRWQNLHWWFWKIHTFNKTKDKREECLALSWIKIVIIINYTSNMCGYIYIHIFKSSPLQRLLYRITYYWIYNLTECGSNYCTIMDQMIPRAKIYWKHKMKFVYTRLRLRENWFSTIAKYAQTWLKIGSMYKPDILRTKAPFRTKLLYNLHLLSQKRTLHVELWHLLLRFASV